MRSRPAAQLGLSAGRATHQILFWTIRIGHIIDELGPFRPQSESASLFGVVARGCMRHLESNDAERHLPSLVFRVAQQRSVSDR